MGFKLPSFADVGFDDPRAVGGLPNYPQNDPGAAGLAVFGKGVSDVGGAFADLAYQRDKLNESNATLDLFTRLSPLLTKLELETDTDKIAEYRAEINSLPQTSAQAIDNPARQKAWMANHAKTILEANASADKRTTLLYRNKSTAGYGELLDRVGNEGVTSDDPQAFRIALEGIQDSLELQKKNGNKLPTEAQEESKRRLKGLVEGRVLSLVNKGKIVEAQALLDTQGDLIADPIQRERFGAQIKARAETMGADSAANRALGLAPALPARRASGGMSVGGAIPSAIADEAGRQNVDPKTALATAQIESAMGRNLGSRGNIFQLGKNEWSTIGGGAMGEPGTDIKNGVAWLGKTQSELAERLGRQPEGWEIYLGHQQGIGGATKLLANPNIPAGQLLPPEHIRANGGDPGAPASEFVAKWRNTFNRTAEGISAGAPPAATEAAAKPIAIGDSIAAHLIRKAGVGGTEYNNVYKDDSTAVSGASPSVVLGTINKTPEGNIRGRDVLLSTGVSNNPAQIDMVADQIKSLKARGAASVTVLGVGTADRVKGANDQLSQIAVENGAVFAGPMRKVAGDGIHSSDPKDLLAQAQAVRPIPTEVGAGAAQPAAVAQPAPPNRTGLPTLAEVERNLAADPTLTSDHARALAFDRARIKYNAREAELARAERIAKETQTAAVNARITAIQKDAYSDRPTISARNIVDDPTFNSDPKLREHMIGFINNPPGSGVPAPQSYAAALNLVERIRLPEGDPQKITDLSQIYDPLVAGKLNKDDFNFAVKQFNDIRTPGGELFNKRKAEFIKRVSPMITKSNPLMGASDPEGEGQMYNLEWLLDQKIDEYRKAGKNPADLLDPGKPDFLGNPKTLEPFQSSMQDEVRQKVKAATGVPSWPSPTAPAPKAPAPAPKGASPRGAPAATAPIPPLLPRNPGETPDEYMRRFQGAP